ncbi:MAG: EthD domain-containing protein [Actinomycetales bacterium]|nr:EthD domain-containing protein [Actinomycetales bacterium]
MPDVLLVGLIAKRPDLTVEQMNAHWRGVHGPLVCAATPRLRPKYIQNHLRDTRVPGFPDSHYDGFAEVWFPGFDQIPGLEPGPVLTDAEQRAEQAFRDDERNFADPSNCSCAFVDEHSIVGERSPLPEGGAKALLFLTAGEPSAQGSSAVLLAERMPGELPGGWAMLGVAIVGASVSPGVAAMGGVTGLDAVLEVALPSRAAFDAYWSANGEGLIAALAALPARYRPFFGALVAEVPMR